MQLEQARVTEHSDVAGTYRELVLEAGGIASTVRPGQFVHMRVPRLENAVLRRPFSVFRVTGQTFSILYKQIGRGTRALREVRPGERVNVLGPLGNGFPLPDGARYPVLVAGGYGVAPLYFLAREAGSVGTVFVGGASTIDLLCLSDFAEIGWTVITTTEDGSAGQRGLVTAALDAWMAETAGDRTLVFYACGPDGMLKAVGERAVRMGCEAWLSLDKHMGCGVGACLACVQKLRRKNGDEVWGRVCKDGPVFEAREIVWE
jgi:dihydroorotate dehydrogenase electron transfer subunit